VDAPAGQVISEDDKANARTFFKRAQQAADSRNYDYAIQLYLDGLKCWPDAVEEGHQMLRLVGVLRRNAGGKKPGMMEAVKTPMTGKDTLKAFLNSASLLARDPNNLTYMEGMLKNAVKMKLVDTVSWLAPLMYEELLTAKKLHAGRYFLIRDSLAQTAEEYEARGDLEHAITAMQRAANVMERLFQEKPHDLEVSNTLRDTSSRLTILKGKYGSGESFRDSIKDAESQAEIYDHDRLVQSTDKLTLMIEKAKQDLEADPNDNYKVNVLVDLLTKEEDAERENEAIHVLEDAYHRLDNYRFKHRADDIRLRQVRRKHREVQDSGDDQAKAEFRRKRMKFELDVFKERVDVYPTDLKIKYQYGERLFVAEQFDEAIPILQEAKADPKVRLRCALLIGRCFLEKEYLAPAIDTFREAIESHEIKGDELSKELNYWLGRSLEADERPDEAVKVYGQLIQWDFNYRDVRARMDALRKK
jgi:hypothetical protein